MKKKAFKAAFPYTLPICVGFLFLGMSYGFMMRSKGFSFVYPLCMSFFIYAGSMEFVTANLLLSAFNPVYAFFLTLMVNARHLFYGISMLEKYKNTGWKKFYLIFGMCDESFTVNCTVDPPEDVDRGWFMFFVNALKTFSYENLKLANEEEMKQWPFTKDSSFYIILNMGLGGNADSWAGPIDDTDLPAIMEIDWVKVSKLNK